MSELAATYRAMHERTLAKKLSNVEQSLNNLKACGIPYVICNHQNHHTLVAEKWDFWPSTGHWRERGTGRSGRGVLKLMRAVREARGQR